MGQFHEIKIFLTAAIYSSIRLPTHTLSGVAKLEIICNINTFQTLVFRDGRTDGHSTPQILMAHLQHNIVYFNSVSDSHAIPFRPTALLSSNVQDVAHV